MDRRKLIDEKPFMNKRWIGNVLVTFYLEKKK